MMRISLKNRVAIKKNGTTLCRELKALNGKEMTLGRELWALNGKKKLLLVINKKNDSGS